ncbi:MAG: enoyl-CoA hydratase/isomerase family protein [Candidatus Sericytochromatia bacterium]|nr:enoyl-CoA hydratase/isomerase family protein [Candidatus Tanganyikabacteria bacterium]
MTTAVEAPPAQYENLLVSADGAVAIIRLNRPAALNALSPQLMAELGTALRAADADPDVRVILLTGGDKVFAAGADIKEMKEASLVDMVNRNMIAAWDAVRSVKKPIVAAVSGFCLGGGCELVMSCDLIVASETAVFGQPEINIGVIPGAGGTQRLTRCVGKYLAMDMILSGRQIKAAEALSHGLVSRVWPVEVFLEEALEVAKEIARKSPIALRMAKESVNKAFETTLTEGLDAERQRFYMLFATEDQKEGMRAFVEKRKAQFTGR